MNNINTKKDTILYWTTTTIFVLFEMMGAVMFNTAQSIDAMNHLGFPHYFSIELAIGKILGGIILMLPQVPARIKEWAYVGFGISLISAFIAIWAVDKSMMAIFPLIVLAVLAVSYKYFHKLGSK